MNEGNIEKGNRKKKKEKEVMRTKMSWRREQDGEENEAGEKKKRKITSSLKCIENEENEGERMEGS